MELRKILVPVAGTEADKEVIELAYRLMAKKGQVCAVYTISIERTLPIDAEIEPEIQKAEAVLNDIENTAVERGWLIETDILQAREVGPAIVNEAIEREVDLILIGVVYQTQFGQFSLGDVVPYVLKNAPCRVMLYQQRS